MTAPEPADLSQAGRSSPGVGGPPSALWSVPNLESHPDPVAPARSCAMTTSRWVSSLATAPRGSTRAATLPENHPRKFLEIFQQVLMRRDPLNTIARHKSGWPRIRTFWGLDPDDRRDHPSPTPSQPSFHHGRGPAKHLVKPSQQRRRFGPKQPGDRKGNGPPKMSPWWHRRKCLL